jgi:pyruvate/2-oxoglutarate dehydrogenase complex dihydrolipoamide acyltransferase (E2) component
MTATTFHKVRSSHPEDDAEGRVFAPGELVPNLDVGDPYNQEKIDSGVFFEIDGEPIQEDPAPGEGSAGDEVNASDAAKRLAEEHEIDLSTIEGTGKDGRIIDTDVESVVEEQDDSNQEGDD